MTTPTDDHAAREAEIRDNERQRIVEEIKEALAEDARRFELTYADATDRWRRDGMYWALRIIERDAQPEGEQ